MASQLSPAQLQTLKTNLAANTNAVLINGVSTQIKDVPQGGQNAQTVADWYNLTAAGPFVLWRKAVSVSATGDAMNATEVGGLTTANLQRLQTLAQYTAGFFDFSLADRRQAFNDVFSGAGGTQTRASLLVAQKQSATNAAKLFATGTGSDASPATSAFADGFVLSGSDVLAAWAS